MTYLFDVNMVITLIDPTHIHHEPAHSWFVSEGSRSWATCPLIQNGVIRILSQPNYPNALDSPAAAAGYLGQLCRLSGHVFWPDNISLLDPQIVDSSRILASSQVTDSYLLALAIAHGGKLATFDRRMVTAAVPSGAQHLHVIDRAPQ